MCQRPEKNKCSYDERFLSVFSFSKLLNQIEVPQITAHYITLYYMNLYVANLHLAKMTSVRYSYRKSTQSNHNIKYINCVFHTV